MSLRFSDKGPLKLDSGGDRWIARIPGLQAVVALYPAELVRQFACVLMAASWVLSVPQKAPQREQQFGVRFLQSLKFVRLHTVLS